MTMSENGQKIVTKEVFDLEVFDTLRLGKYVQVPEKPKSLTEVQSIPGMNEQKLLDLVYEGLCKEAGDYAEKQPDGWHEMTADDQLDEEVYKGSSADPDKKKLIDAMILNFAKAAFGFQKNEGSDPKIRDANAKAKDAAREAIKSNRAMVDSIVNAK
jgi:hypothetical protein